MYDKIARRVMKNSMIDLKKGTVKIADDLSISPNYTFDEFKKTSFYNTQDGVRVIDLDNQQFCIDGTNYLVSFFFRDNKICVLSLLCCEEQYSEENEKERKKLHDVILKKYGVIGKKEFTWGRVSSDYDARGNCSSINFLYF